MEAKIRRTRLASKPLVIGWIVLFGLGCSTEQMPESFRYKLLEEWFSGEAVTLEEVRVESPADVLFIVDNSGSMGNDQATLADGFVEFANTYLNPDRSIRVGVLTTDTYLAGAGGNYPTNFAKLIAPYHDGVTPQIHVQPRSGVPIIDSKHSTAKESQALFAINGKPGTQGSGSERALQSIQKFFDVSEKSADCRGDNPPAHCFFRKNANRAIVIVSDECSSDWIEARRAKQGRNGDCNNILTDPEMIASFKGELDQFFNAIDEASDPRYFVGAIVNPSPLGGNQQYYGKEYIELVDQLQRDVNSSLGRYSAVRNINIAQEYSEFFAELGNTIISENQVTTQVFVLRLSRAPTQKSDVIITAAFADGFNYTLALEDWALSGKEVRIDANRLLPWIQQHGQVLSWKVLYHPSTPY